MDDNARTARNEYHRQWRRKHPEQWRRIQEKYWGRKADKEKDGGQSDEYENIV